MIPVAVLDSIWNTCIDLQRSLKNEEVCDMIASSSSLLDASSTMKIMFSAMYAKSYLELGKAISPSKTKQAEKMSRDSLRLL